MLSIVRDALSAYALKFRYQRLARERVLQLWESHRATRHEVEQDGVWHPLASPLTSRGLEPTTQANLRDEARRLVRENPHARNVLRLLESYVVGPDCRVSARPTRASRTPAGQRADTIWKEFLTKNCRHFSYQELARRTWRDGECFLRIFPDDGWPPTVRFLDPETIGPTHNAPDSHGILTRPQDVETPVFYLRIDPQTGELSERIPADEILHVKINADSNEPRGVSLFAPLIAPLRQYERWLETELMARKLQASIVLWRKVADGPVGGWGSDPAEDIDLSKLAREQLHPGSIMTTNSAVDLQFLQPGAALRDAAPLGRMMLLAAAAGAGLPEYMLTGDASNANYASTMIAEGPAVKFFQAEQRFFAGELSRLWRKVMARAVAGRQLPRRFLTGCGPEWTFPTLVARDRPRERYADVRLVQTGILSRAEVARRENVDPLLMRDEIAAEAQPPTSTRQILWGTTPREALPQNPKRDPGEPTEPEPRI